MAEEKTKVKPVKTYNILAELGYGVVEGVKTVPSTLAGYRILKQPVEGDGSEPNEVAEESEGGGIDD